MKKSRSLSFVAFLAFVVLSCESNNESILPVEKDSFPVEISNGIVKFTSVEDYTDLVENYSAERKSKFIEYLDKEANYVSLKAKAVRDAELARVASEEIDPNDFLSTILNEDGIVEIGENIFLVDTAEQVVLVLPSVNQDQVDDLVNRNLENANIILFSTGDDVLDLLEEGSTGTINRSAGLFCREDGAPREKDDDYDVSPYGVDIRQDNKIVYQQAGIYFSLQSKTKVQFRGWTGIWSGQSAPDQIIRYYAAYKPKCKGWVVKQGDRLDDGADNELNYRPYESTRGLHQYEFNVLFYGFGYWSRSYYIIHI